MALLKKYQNGTKVKSAKEVEAEKAAIMKSRMSSESAKEDAADRADSGYKATINRYYDEYKKPKVVSAQEPKKLLYKKTVTPLKKNS